MSSLIVVEARYCAQNLRRLPLAAGFFAPPATADGDPPATEIGRVPDECVGAGKAA